MAYDDNSHCFLCGSDSPDGEFSDEANPPEYYERLPEVMNPDGSITPLKTHGKETTGPRN